MCIRDRFTGIPYLMMCAKVQKVGSVLLMGLITGLIYYVTGQFTLVIFITFVLACGLAELTRGRTHYRSMAGNLVSFVLFSLGMVGSPLPIWLIREDFLRQITEQGMPADYVNTCLLYTSHIFMPPAVRFSIGCGNSARQGLSGPAGGLPHPSCIGASGSDAMFHSTI